MCLSIEPSEPTFRVRGFNFITTLCFIPLKCIINLWVRELIALKTLWKFTKPLNPNCSNVYLSVSHMSVCLSVHFSFPDDNLSKHQWIFTKLGMCIDIVEMWFGIANGKILSNFLELSA